MIGDAISAMNPSLRFSIDGEVKTEADYNNITWFDGIDPSGSAFKGNPVGIPAWQDVQAQILVMRDEQEATKYQRDRKSERSTRMPLELQLEAIVEQMRVDSDAGKEMTRGVRDLLSIDATIRTNHKKP